MSIEFELALAAARFISKAIRTRAFRRAVRFARHGWPIRAWWSPSDLSGFGLITAVPAGEVEATSSFDDVRRIRGAIPIVPATLDLAIRNVGEDHIQIDEIYLMPRAAEPVTSLDEWAAIVYPLPGAGGRGPEADFEVWHRAGRTASIALLASALQSGGDISRPLLAPKDGYTILLDIFPDAPARYRYDIWARCSSDGTEWSQPLVRDVALLRIKPTDYQFFGEVALVRYGEPTQITQAIPDYFVPGRESARAWRNRPQIPSDRSALVAGRASKVSDWPAVWRK